MAERENDFAIAVGLHAAGGRSRHTIVRCCPSHPGCIRLALPHVPGGRQILPHVSLLPVRAFGTSGAAGNFTVRNNKTPCEVGS